jgi:hypothetical protein
LTSTIINNKHASFDAHQDRQDPQVGGEYVDANFGTMSDFATKIEAEFRALPVPEEPRGGTPGLFAPAMHRSPGCPGS